MIDCTKITEIANAKLVGTDLFVVDCTCSPANEVELLIDSCLLYTSDAADE